MVIAYHMLENDLYRNVPLLSYALFFYLRSGVFCELMSVQMCVAF